MHKMQHSKQRPAFRFLIVSLALGLLLAACGGPTAEPGGDDEAESDPDTAEADTEETDEAGGDGRYTVAVNLSYTGNDWQDAAANLIRATAATPPFDEMVDLRVDIAGADVTAQNQLINQQVAAGVDAIIIYPISPTALNSAVAEACAAGIIVHAYDSIISEPCAYNAFVDQYEWGRGNAQWLVDELGGEGDIAVITGVPGTTVDSLRNEALADVLAENPGINVVGSENGEWAQAQGRNAFERIEASAENIDGIWAQAGCYAIIEYLVSSGQDPLPCSGEGSNGGRHHMLPESEGGLNAPRITASSTVFPGSLAFLNVMRLLQGDDSVPKVTLIPVTALTNDDIVLGTNPAEGANAFPEDMVPPGFFAEIWSPLVDQGIQGALTGESDKISDALPCSEVSECTELDEVPYDFDS